MSVSEVRELVMVALMVVVPFALAIPVLLTWMGRIR